MKFNTPRPRSKTMDELRPQAFVKGLRKDGRYAVQFLDPLNGARRNKVIKREDLDILILEKRYEVYGASENYLRAR